jgi:hypothetical protein
VEVKLKAPVPRVIASSDISPASAYEIGPLAVRVNLPADAVVGFEFKSIVFAVTVKLP